MAQSVGFISLGCAKNQVDCEQMMFLLQQAGYRICATPENTDLIIINTCGFIESAKTEAIDRILYAASLKEQGLTKKILVTGCLAQRYQQQILEELPEVDGVLGTGSYYEIVAAAKAVLDGETLSRYGSIDDTVPETGRILTTPAYYSYLKIAEGCDNRCAYCVIPSLRGRFRSRSLDDCLYEARTLAESGVKELIVVAQDTSRYGIDRYGKRMLPELLRQLCAIEKLHWVRVHYCYPDEITDELIDVFATEQKLVKYMDIPIQHVNNTILRRMNRRGNKEYLEQLFPRLRERIPGLVIRTSLITGLPGEGETEFEELCEFLKRHKLERVGAFAFSPEEGTPAAEMEYPDESVARRRAELIEQLQSRVIDEYNRKQCGKTAEILCEGYDRARKLWFGRSAADSPDIDGIVYFSADTPIKEGVFVQVKIQTSQDADLYGVAAGEGTV